MDHGGAGDPPPNPDPTRCKLWILHKKRHCRGTVHRGSLYCGAHLANDTTAQWGPGEERVPCPINGNHSIAVKDLKHHITVCPDLRNVAAVQPYYSRGCNGGRPTVGAEQDKSSSAEFRQMDKRATSTRHFKRLDSAGLRALIDRVNHIYAAEVERQLQVHDPASQSQSLTCRGSSTATPYASKQSPQLSALCNVMRQCGLVPALSAAGVQRQWLLADGSALWSRKPTLLELAAGKGAFALAVAEVWAEHGRHEVAEGETSFTAPQVIVADRGGFRRKADGRVALDAQEEDSGEAVQLYRPFVRLRVDLRDLALDQVADLSAAPALVAFGKHLCGNCTDYGITSVLRGASPTCSWRGAASIFIAPCCHHLAERANLSRYVLGLPKHRRDGSPLSEPQQVAADALRRLLGEDGAADDDHGSLSGDYFDLVCSLSSWAVIGDRNRCVDGTVESEHKAAPEEEGDAAHTAAEASLTLEDKIAVGRRAKRIVDWVRVLTLRAWGYNACYMDNVVDVSHSPENGVILAVNNSDV